MIKSHNQCGNSFWTSSHYCKDLIHDCHRRYATFHVTYPSEHTMYRIPKFDNWAPKIINHDTALHDFNYNYHCMITDRTCRLSLSESHYISLFLSQDNQKKNCSSHCISFYVIFQASAAKLLRTALFWVITQRVLVISYRLFGKTCRSHPLGSRIRNP
jgi:hypothetical protein